MVERYNLVHNKQYRRSYQLMLIIWYLMAVKMMKKRLVKNSGNNAVGGFGKKQVCALLWFTHII
jgi:hypothetical protein